MPVIIQHNLNSFGVDIVIYEENEHSGRTVASVGPHGLLVFTPHTLGSSIKPTIEGIPIETMKEIIIQAAKLDIRTEEESTIRGKHQAQTAHMLDLQGIIGWFMNGQKPVKIDLGSGGKVTQLPFGMQPFMVGMDAFKKK